MANVLVDENSLSDIADAIRAKNGTSDTYKPSEMADAISAISGGGITPTGTKEISITQNGTVTEDVTNYANAQISANVPNSYTQSDEGKVVVNGSLASQSSQSITENGTYDTTTKNSVTVDVSGGGGGVKTASGSFTLTNAPASLQTQTVNHNANMTPLLGVLYVERDENDQVVSIGGYQLIYGIFVNTSYVTPTADSLYTGATVVSNYTSNATKEAAYSSITQNTISRIVSCWTNQAAQWRNTDKSYAFLNVIDSNSVTFTMQANAYFYNGTYKWVLWGV